MPSEMPERTVPRSVALVPASSCPQTKSNPSNSNLRPRLKAKLTIRKDHKGHEEPDKKSSRKAAKAQRFRGELEINGLNQGKPRLAKPAMRCSSNSTFDAD